MDIYHPSSSSSDSDSDASSLASSPSSASRSRSRSRSASSSSDEVDERLGAMTVSQADDAMRKELEEIQKEQKKLIETLTADTGAEARKGMAARNQRALFDASLEMRIKLQRALVLANRFPKHNVLPLFEQRSPAVKEAMQRATADAISIVDSLLDLRSALARANPEVPAVPTRVRDRDYHDTDDRHTEQRDEREDEREHEAGPVAARVARVWAAVRAADDALRPYCDAALDKWHRRVHQTGSAPAKQLHAFHQSITSQVDALLADQARALRKARLRRTAYRVLGEAAPADAGAQAVAELYDPEVYDDADFYQEQLRELISAAGQVDATDPAAMTQRYLQMRKLQSKVKKAVDRRASKGRKIRYNVHDKLVSFMPPIETETMPADIRSDLFANLFGRNEPGSAPFSLP